MIGEAGYIQSLKTGQKFTYPRDDYVDQRKLNEEIKKYSARDLCPHNYKDLLSRSQSGVSSHKNPNAYVPRKLPTLESVAS